MHSDAWHGAPFRHHEVELRRAPAHHLEQLGDGVVAERGSLPRGEDRREHLTLARQRGVADRIHAAMVAVQDTALDALANPVSAQAERHELRGCREPVLPARQPGEGLVDFVTSQVTFRTHPPNPERERVTDLHASVNSLCRKRHDSSARARIASNRSSHEAARRAIHAAVSCSGAEHTT